MVRRRDQGFTPGGGAGRAVIAPGIDLKRHTSNGFHEHPANVLRASESRRPPARATPLILGPSSAAGLETAGLLSCFGREGMAGETPGGCAPPPGGDRGPPAVWRAGGSSLIPDRRASPGGPTDCRSAASSFGQTRRTFSPPEGNRSRRGSISAREPVFVAWRLAEVARCRRGLSPVTGTVTLSYCSNQYEDFDAVSVDAQQSDPDPVATGGAAEARHRGRWCPAESAVAEHPGARRLSRHQSEHRGARDRGSQAERVR